MHDLTDYGDLPQSRQELAIDSAGLYRVPSCPATPRWSAADSTA
jgi:hypothetical protein